MWARVNAAVVRAEDGRALRMLAVVEDITQHAPCSEQGMHRARAGPPGRRAGPVQRRPGRHRPRRGARSEGAAPRNPAHRGVSARRSSTASGHAGREKLERLDRLAKRMHDLLDALPGVRSGRAGRNPTWARVRSDGPDGGCEGFALRAARARGRGSRSIFSRGSGATASWSQVFANLIINALQYNESGEKRIEIGAEAESDAPVFFVRDNGIGIDPAHSGTIFRMFKSACTLATATAAGRGRAWRSPSASSMPWRPDLAPLRRGRGLDILLHARPGRAHAARSRADARVGRSRRRRLEEWQRNRRGSVLGATVLTGVVGWRACDRRGFTAGSAGSGGLCARGGTGIRSARGGTSPAAAERVPVPDGDKPVAPPSFTDFRPSRDGLRSWNSFSGSSLPIDLGAAAETSLGLPRRFGLCGGMSCAAADYFLAVPQSQRARGRPCAARPCTTTCTSDSPPRWAPRARWP